MTNTISFPGLSIGEFTLNRAAVTINGFAIYWYGIIIGFGFLLGLLYMYYRFRTYGLNSDNLLDVALAVIPSAVVGARLYYVLTSLDEYHSLWDVINIREGGLAIYGGVIAGALAVVVVCKIRKFPMLKVFDSIAPAVMLGQILGRWGNFVNAEAYGIIDRFEFFGKVIETPSFEKSNIFRMTVNGMTVHPTFLYESVWNLIGFVLINVFYKKKKFDGEIVLWYLTWYGFGRCIIEGFRGDSLFVGSIRISQLVGFLCFAFGLVLTLLFRHIKNKNSEAVKNGDNN